ncbi:uncharacterized protein LOC105189584 isoform X1 [Harpegnathos saltator]|uniref:EGF-like domain-containing protein n=1 Tax=Harpegnathos saltator TaxID=610380 RepID=E2C3K2_HARSA|nr:uncharacterized protein LOC105189584 isoform X1 [Harpegnathos saltator]EFN77540.1 hypothetical protein EAI_11553 [Harpegnathos saltator]
MRSTRADVFCYLIVAIFALPTLSRAEGQDDKTQPRKCSITDLSHMQCGKHEKCRANGTEQGWCECQLGFHLVNGECVRVTPTAANFDLTTVKPELKPESGGSSVAAGLLIPTFLVVVAVLLYVGARRYKWLQRFRQYRHNRYGNVLVTRDDDDDDDPPIA